MKSAARKEIPVKANKLMLCVLGFVLVFAVAAASAADAPKLTFKFVTTNVPGALQTFPNNINNANVMVGQYEDSQGVYHGYILSGSELITLDDPNGTSTYANGINSNGPIMVVGYYFNSSTGEETGFRYTCPTSTPCSNGTWSDILPPGAVLSAAYGINDYGWIVGKYNDSTSGVEHGFLLRGTTYTYPLDVPGATHTFLEDINNAGDIVLGWKNPSGAYEGAVYNLNTHKHRIINVPGAGPMGSVPYSINNEGDITFAWYDQFNLQHGALFHGGQVYKFENAKPCQEIAGGVNDENTFVGSYEQGACNIGYFDGFTATFQ